MIVPSVDISFFNMKIKYRQFNVDRMYVKFFIDVLDLEVFILL